MRYEDYFPEGRYLIDDFEDEEDDISYYWDEEVGEYKRSINIGGKNDKD